MARLTPLRNVAVTVDGVTHNGTYYVQSKTVYVQSLFGNMATQVGGMPPERVARFLLSELVRSKHSPAPHVRSSD